MNIFKKYINPILKKKKRKIKRKINFSFELFPSSKLILKKNFISSINKINSLNPTFISVTHRSNNKKKNNTYNFIKTIKNYINSQLVPHITCINNTREELKNIIKKYLNKKIKHVIALRGDSLKLNKKYKIYAIDLIILLKKISDFYISVAAYPEVHPEAKSERFDLINLKNKFDAGADQAITQFFFDIETFLRFRDKCSGIGIKKKIIPGILLINNFNQVYKFCLFSNIYLPKWIKNLYLKSNNFKDNTIGLNIAINMIKSLYKEGVYDFHIYTLNKLNFSYSVCNAINLN
ncbi:methylenetetrahydrofolate reductase [Buchnera aphidicola (Periphyllus koelreuteriae)]|uniref:methylenetetrahydrofolate reductase n=1 Tax=Buchnera aphidicola TaxID=9 RepID=UPI0031B8436F